MSYKFYSQCGQDRLIYESFFKDKRNGFFVEIGAADGIELSNTYFFEKYLGWNGICVEPRKIAFDKLTINRSCHCENVCISDANGEKNFVEFIGGTGALFSGIKDKYEKEHLEKIKDPKIVNFETKNEITLPSITFNQLCEKHNVKHIDYCSMDTEGGELDILKSLDDAATISCLSIENNYQNKEIPNYMKSKGYILFKKLDFDEIYIHRDFGFKRYSSLLFFRTLMQLYRKYLPAKLRNCLKVRRILESINYTKLTYRQLTEFETVDNPKDDKLLQADTMFLK